MIVTPLQPGRIRLRMLRGFCSPTSGRGNDDHNSQFENDRWEWKSVIRGFMDVGAIDRIELDPWRLRGGLCGLGAGCTEQSGNQKTRKQQSPSNGNDSGAIVLDHWNSALQVKTGRVA